jgi:hypothetical protein
MGYIKEPAGIDFVVDPTPFTAVGLPKESTTPLLCVVCGIAAGQRHQQQNYRKLLPYFFKTIMQ